MKFWKLALCASVASFGMAGAALADAPAAPAEIKPAIVFNAGVASEYLFRGLSQTRNGIEVFGGADLTYGKLYAGTWISNLDFGKPGNPTTAEVDLYGGYRPSIGPVNLDIGGIAYTYAHQPSGLAGTETYFEAKGMASIAVGKGTIGGTVAYSPQFPVKTGHATYIEANASFPVWKGLSVSGAVGHQYLEASKNFGFSGYTTYNIGATYAFNSHISLDGRFVGNDSGAKVFYGSGKTVPFNARDRGVVTLKVTFP